MRECEQSIEGIDLGVASGIAPLGRPICYRSFHRLCSVIFLAKTLAHRSAGRVVCAMSPKLAPPLYPSSVVFVAPRYQRSTAALNRPTRAISAPPVAYAGEFAWGASRLLNARAACKFPGRSTAWARWAVGDPNTSRVKSAPPKVFSQEDELEYLNALEASVSSVQARLRYQAQGRSAWLLLQHLPPSHGQRLYEQAYSRPP